MSPVGIKFFNSKLNGIERIDKKHTFYLGVQGLPHFEAGLEGPRLGLY
jgi:hypothetical protein